MSIINFTCKTQHLRYLGNEHWECRNCTTQFKSQPEVVQHYEKPWNRTEITIAIVREYYIFDKDEK